MTRYNIEYRKHNDRSHLVIFEFDNEAEAKEFLRLAQISKDIDDELLLYGDGVLRTMENGKKLEKSSRGRSPKRRR